MTANLPTATKRPLRPYSLGEEIANSVIHGLGAVLSVAALTMLVIFAVQNSDVWQLGASITYGITLVLGYVSSTLYHSFPWPRVKHLFKIFDHAAIYLLIAGTYTPFTLVTLRYEGGWWLFIAVWVLAILGIALESMWTYRPAWISVLVYSAMGWLVVFAISPLIESLPPAGIWLLVGGGLAYSIGTIFYLLKKIPYTHAIWHVFVLAGSVSHFLAVVLFVL